MRNYRRIQCFIFLFLVLQLAGSFVYHMDYRQKLLTQNSDYVVISKRVDKFISEKTLKSEGVLPEELYLSMEILDKIEHIGLGDAFLFYNIRYPEEYEIAFVNSLQVFEDREWSKFPMSPEDYQTYVGLFGTTIEKYNYLSEESLTNSESAGYWIYCAPSSASRDDFLYTKLMAMALINTKENSFIYIELER